MRDLKENMVRTKGIMKTIKKNQVVISEFKKYYMK